MCQPHLFLTLLFSFLLPYKIIAQPLPAKPTIQLPTIYKAPSEISEYWISEKLDGVRGYWDGAQLFTKQGNIISTPVGFTKNWPSTALDGELWSGRNQFEQIVSCVRKKIANSQCWKKIRFMIFDLPSHKGNFNERLLAMKNLIKNSKTNNIDVIKQSKVNSNKQLMQKLTSIVSNNAEGLMLHHQNAFYKLGRNTDLMKLKKYQDAEAVVIKHFEGKGKYQGKLGALQVKTSAGIIFKIGSGFTDKERSNPPNIGDTITFKYFGLTKRGVPRFASFMRIRERTALKN